MARSHRRAASAEVGRFVLLCGILYLVNINLLINARIVPEGKAAVEGKLPLRLLYRLASIHAITDFGRWRDMMDKRIEATKGIIEREYDKALRVGELARRVGLSRSHLELLFKQETGLSVNAYHREVRLQWGLELMSEEHMSVKGAAFSVGYRSASNFSRDIACPLGLIPEAQVRQ